MSISDVQEIPCLSQNPNVCVYVLTTGGNPEADIITPYTQNFNLDTIFWPNFSLSCAWEFRFFLPLRFSDQNYASIFFSFIQFIQGVPGGMCQSSGECSLC